MSGATSASSMAYLSLGGQIVGGLMGAKGAYDQASTQKQVLAIQAEIAQRNAQINEQQAEIALQNGQINEQASRLRTGQMMGTQRAALAANGVDLGEGSANDVLTTTAFMGEHDALTIRDNATRQAWAYRVQAANNMSNADVLQTSGDNINPTMSAMGSLLTSAGSVAGSWYKFKKEGVF
ncbi:MAG: hypothetical protein JSR19_06960 [Proteobacteria bacterium]|nr:hypothetical protein [Pseudomonadota bacterium]